MNINLKSEEEIKLMIEGGKILKEVVKKLKAYIKEGVLTEEIDHLAEKFILDFGAEPSFKRVKNYYWTICAPVNEQVVHTPPSKKVLKKGDLFTLDIGVFYKGFHTDFAETYLIGDLDNKEKRKFLEVGRRTLNKAIKSCQVYGRLGSISQTIEEEIERNGYFILKDLTGHGIGKDLHEDPYVFGYLDKPIEKTIVLKPGLVIAIEVIYSMGSEEIDYEKDNQWSVITKDKSLSACFEHTIAITEKKVLVLT